MTTMAVIVVSDEGGRALLRTADSVAGQGSVRELMLALPGNRPIPLADSIAQRLGATAVRHGERGDAAVNEAARLTTGAVLAIVPAGVELHPRALATALALFQASPEAVALASPLGAHTPDGLGVSTCGLAGATVAAMLTDPGAVPAVLFVTRAAWEHLDGLDPAFDELAIYEFWLRSRSAGRPSSSLTKPSHRGNCRPPPRSRGSPSPGWRSSGACSSGTGRRSSRS